MKEFNLKDYLPKKLFLVLVPALILINLGISQFAKYLEIPSIKNTMPFSLNIESELLYGVFGIIFVFLLVTKMYNKHPLSSSFIIVGAFYNLFERSYYGYVYDFIKITWGFINLADLMLWFGLILLNYEVWFNTEDELEPIAYASVVESQVVTETYVQNELSIPPKSIEAPKKLEVKALEVKKEEPKKIIPEAPLASVAEEPKSNDIFSSIKTSKIKTVADQLKKIRSADTQEIFVPKMDFKPKKNPLPKIKVS